MKSSASVVYFIDEVFCCLFFQQQLTAVSETSFLLVSTGVTEL